MQLCKNSYTDSIEKMLVKVGVELPGNGMCFEQNTGEFLVDTEGGFTSVGYSLTDAYITCLKLFGNKVQSVGLATEDE